MVETKPKMSDYEVEQLLVKAFADESSSMEVIKELATRLFPNEDIRSKAKIAMLNKEVQKFTHESEVIGFQDSYDDGGYQRINFECTADDFLIWHPKMTQLQEFLVNQYQMDIEFDYWICEMKEYIEPSEQEETPVLEMPKMPVTFDIDLE